MKPTDAVGEIKSRFSTGIATEQPDHADDNLNCCETYVLNAAKTYDETAIIIAHEQSGQHLFWSPSWLLVEDFKKYVDKICGGGIVEKNAKRNHHHPQKKICA